MRDMRTSCGSKPTGKRDYADRATICRTGTTPAGQSTWRTLNRLQLPRRARVSVVTCPCELAPRTERCGSFLVQDPEGYLVRLKILPEEPAALEGI